MSSWMTLDDMEGGMKKRNYKSRDGESLVIKIYWQIFGLHFATAIRYNITTIGATLIYHWRGHGLPCFGQIVNLHGTLP